MQAWTLKCGGMALCAAGLVACGGGEDEPDSLRSEGAASAPMARLASVAPMVLVTLQPTDLDFPGPERGFYRFATDPSKITATSLLYVAQEGQRLVYTPADLSAYRTRSLPSSYLNKLETGFANLRKQGLKTVLRFAYNYPETEAEYLNAQDATLSRVKSHIQQLQPVLQRNADVIAVMQGGFIGAWGEWHTSSHNLTTPARKAAVRDALLQALPVQRLLQVRYPADLARWYPEPVTLAQWLSSSPPPAARVGLHNDCFLASTDDVGTYFAETVAESQALRTYAQKATTVTGAGGETCAPPRTRPGPHDLRLHSARGCGLPHELPESRLLRRFLCAVAGGWLPGGGVPAAGLPGGTANRSPQQHGGSPGYVGLVGDLAKPGLGPALERT